MLDMHEVTGKNPGVISMRSVSQQPIAILAALCFSLLGCMSFPESSFELAHESRLPKWFTLPPGLARSDVSVSMDYYIKSTGGIATFTLKNLKKNKILVAVNGTIKGDEPHKLKNPRPGFPLGYPAYEIITVRGITEIIEHRRMEPIFYITDDPVVRSDLGLSSAHF
jgi:hypothetical protein